MYVENLRDTKTSVRRESKGQGICIVYFELIRKCHTSLKSIWLSKCTELQNFFMFEKLSLKYLSICVNSFLRLDSFRGQAGVSVQ